MPQGHLLLYENQQNPDKEKQKYLEIFKQKGALKATLNWYRANISNSSESIGDIYVSTLIIYGKEDMAVAEKSDDSQARRIASVARKFPSLGERSAAHRCTIAVVTTVQPRLTHTYATSVPWLARQG